MATGKGTTTVDFGTGATDVSAAVSVPALTTEYIEAWVVPATTASNTQDNHWVEELEVMAGPVNNDVGFTLYAKCKNGLAHGIYNVAYVYA